MSLALYKSKVKMRVWGIRDRKVGLSTFSVRIGTGLACEFTSSKTGTNSSMK